MDQLSTDTFASKRLALTMGGVAENIALPAQRHVSFALTGAATGITAVRADVAKALGEQINLDIAGDWKAGAPIRLAKAQLSGNDLSVLLAGDVADYAFNGDIKVKAASIAPFSELAGRQLSGALDMDAAGSIEPINGAFDLSIDSVASGLGIGSEPVDNLLAGDTRITGSLARGETGIVARQLRVFNSQTSATANGTFASGAADFDFDFELNDLALLSDRAAGKLTAKGRAKGSDGLIGLTFSANVAERLVGRQAADGRGSRFRGDAAERRGRRANQRAGACSTACRSGFRARSRCLKRSAGSAPSISRRAGPTYRATSSSPFRPGSIKDSSSLPRPTSRQRRPFS